VKETSVCIVDETGKICRELKVVSHPDDLVSALKEPDLEIKRIGLEASPLSQWLFEGLVKAGLPAICIETRNHLRAQQRHRVCPAQALRDESVGEPGAGGASKTVSLGGSEGAGQHPDHSDAGAELPQLIRQTADRRIVGGVAELSQHRAKVLSCWQILAWSYGQPAPRQKHPSAWADVITGLRQKDCVAQRIFTLDAPSLPRRHRGSRKRQPLPPGAGPALLPADHRVERADGRAPNEGDVCNVLAHKALRIGDGAA